MKITLKAARVNNNLTQKKAAEEIGVSVDTIRSWEKSETFPSAEMIPRIERVYRISYDNIIFLPRCYA